MTKFSDDNLAHNEQAIIKVARESGNEFYSSALQEYDTALAVLNLAKEELLVTLRKIAMQVKLMDDDALRNKIIDVDKLAHLKTPGEKVRYLMSKGQYKFGGQSLVECGIPGFEMTK